MNTSIYPEFNQVSATILKQITIKYNNLELATARSDRKYGQCEFSRKFFSNPHVAMLTMLGNHHISNISEWSELGETRLSKTIEDAKDGYFESIQSCPVNFDDYLLEVSMHCQSGFSCPINFADYLLEVVEQAFN